MSDLQPQSASRDLARSRLPPRRATQACLSCRLRKVRCDVSFREGPCTNCQLDGVECRVVSPRRRPRQNTNRERISHGLQLVPSNRSGGFFTFLGGTFTELRNTSGLPMHHLSHLTRGQHRGTTSNTLPFRLGKHTKNTSQPSDYSHQHTNSFPDFIKTFEVPGAGTLEVLQQKGVFELPPTDLQQIVLDKYEDFVHPLLPVLDVVKFRRAIDGQETDDKVSLFLYHAVIFIGLSCVDNNTVSRLAHVSKQAARVASYEKAKVLFEMDVEKDRAAICRASILLTGHPYQFDPKDATYWLGVAISQAYNMKLFRLQMSSLGRRERNLERILWWCVLIKECEVAMGMDHPPRVWPYDSPMLAMSDFGLDDQEQLQTSEGKAALGFILKAKLYSRIYQLMRNIYEEIQPWNIKQGGEVLPALRQHMLDHLHSWISEVPPELRYEYFIQHKCTYSEPGIAWSMTISEITYWAAHFTVYMDNLQHYLPQHHSPGAKRPTDYKQSRPFLRHAAGKVTEILKTVLACNMAGFLPSASVVQILLAGFIHYRDTKDKDPVIHQTSVHNLEVCLRVFQLVADSYPFIVEVATRFQQSAGMLDDIYQRRHLYAQLNNENNPSDLESHVQTTESPSVDAAATAEGGRNPRSEQSSEENEPSQQVYESNSRVDEGYLEWVNRKLSSDWISMC
ncbi:hypothetical protein BDV06DRAFT_194212 [Aspergillus oleicola]